VDQGEFNIFSTANIKHNFKEGREEIQNASKYDIYKYCDILEAQASFFQIMSYSAV